MRCHVIILVAIFGLSVQVPQDNPEDIVVNKFHDVCIQETNVDPNILANPDQNVVEADRNAKCFVRCVMMKSGLLNDQTELQIKAVQDALNLDENHSFIEQMKKCQAIKMEDPCETAFAIHKCSSVA